MPTANALQMDPSTHAPADDLLEGGGGRVQDDLLVDPLTREDVVHQEQEVGKEEDVPSANPLAAADGLRAAFGDSRGTSADPPPPGKDGNANTMPKKGEGGRQRTVAMDPQKVSGTATVVNSAYASDESSDYASMTNRFLNESRMDPSADDADLWKRAVQNDRNPGGFISTYAPKEEADPSSTMGGFPMQFAQVQSDNTRVDPAYAGQIIQNQRAALVISNADYSINSLDLKWSHNDGGAMAAYFSSQGYAVDHRKDIKASEMTSALKGMSGGFLPGDSVAVYYVGHGDEKGMIGADCKTSPYSDLNGIASGALSGGYHAQIITDCCQSGAVVGSMDVALGNEFGDMDRSFQDLTIDTEKAASDPLLIYNEDGTAQGRVDDKESKRSLYTRRF